MIITKTPYRISFLGGGTDFEDYYNKYNGLVLGSSINKFCYVGVRKLPPFFNHKHRISWSVIENVNKFENIEHPLIKSILKQFTKLNKNYGFSVHHDGDLPGNSGIGSSSSFCVGLIKAIYEMQKTEIPKLELVKKAYFIENKILKENTGIQDQTFAAYGGLNYIEFKKKGPLVKKLKLNSENRKNLEDSIILFYTGKSRFSKNIEKDKISNFNSKLKYFHQIKSLAKEGVSLLSKNYNLKNFGKLLNEYWELKNSLSNKVSHNYLNEMYNEGIKLGAYGGKIIGAGGGGFMMFICSKKIQKKLINKFKNNYSLNIKFHDEGSETILKS